MTAGQDEKHSVAPLVAGGRFIGLPAVFSLDSKVVFLALGNDVVVRSARTAGVLGRLKGHTGSITGMCTNPKSKFQLVTTSRDRTIKVWDFSDLKCLRTISVKPTKKPSLKVHIAQSRFRGILHMDMASCQSIKRIRSQNTVYVSVLCDAEESQITSGTEVLEVDLSSGSCTSVLTLPWICDVLRVSPTGSHVALLHNNKMTIFNALTSHYFQYSIHDQLRALAFHPSRDLFVVSNAMGKLLRCSGFSTASTKGELHVSELGHWHAHAVDGLSFTDDGAYVLSGGEESVLVLWKHDSGARQFIPRLGAPVSGIRVSPDGSTYALTCRDNVIRLMSAVTNRCTKQIAGLRFAHTLPGVRAKLETGLVLDPRMNCVSLLGTPGVLQFFDVHTDRERYCLEVVSRNMVSRMDDEHPSQPEVQHVAFSGLGSLWKRRRAKKTDLAGGEWMATVDRITPTGEEQFVVAEDAQRLEGYASLKFWNLDVTGHHNDYVLNTRVNDPHHGNISALTFHPTKSECVTVGDVQDPCIRIWTAVPRVMLQSVAVRPEADQLMTWKCRAVATYHDSGSTAADHQLGVGGSQSANEQRKRTHKPNLTACHGGATYSSDGSLLCVAFGHVLTLWDVHSLELKRTLVCSTAEDVVRGAYFVGDTPYLVAHTQHRLVVFDLLTLSEWWSAPVKCKALAVDPVDAFFAVLVRSEIDTSKHKYNVLVFDPQSASPVLTWRLQLARDEKPQSKGLTFGEDFLCCLTSSFRLLHIPFSYKDVAQGSKNGQSVTVSATPRRTRASENADDALQKASLFEQLYKVERKEKERVASFPTKEHTAGPSDDPVNTLWDTAAHAVPSMDHLFSSFARRMLCAPHKSSGRPDNVAEIAETSGLQDTQRQRSQQSSEKSVPPALAQRATHNPYLEAFATLSLTVSPSPSPSPSPSQQPQCPPLAAPASPLSKDQPQHRRSIRALKSEAEISTPVRRSARIRRAKV